MVGDRTYRWAWRQATGTLRYRSILQHTVGYTETSKKVAAGSSAAVLAAVTASGSAATSVTSGFTNPDVPRVISVTAGGTAGDIATCVVVVTGTNVEGKTITESYSFSANTAATVTGVKAFKAITQLDIPAQDGGGATFAVGTGNALGLNHRLVPNKSTIVVIQDTAVDGNDPTLQAAPSASTVHGTVIEQNTVTPATTPDGSTFLTVLYWYHNVIPANPLDDDPTYGTSTSTSSSTSTSQSTSTSISTSSTSSSTSSTSVSSSSTSTSTTTAL